MEKGTFTRKKPFIFLPFSTIFSCGKIGKNVLITKWKKCGKIYIKVDKKIYQPKTKCIKIKKS